MRKNYIKANILGEDGNVYQSYIDQDTLRSTIGQKKELTPILRKHIEDKIEWLKKIIKRAETLLESDELDEWDRLKISLWKDECLIDLREDEHLIKYDGDIPKYIDERCVRKASRVYGRYRQSIGHTKFLQLKDEVDIDLRESVIVDADLSTGGGKV